jgi:hypothetical protein
MLGATLGSTFQWCYRHPRSWPSKFEREICQSTCDRLLEAVWIYMAIVLWWRQTQWGLRMLT